MSDSPEFTPSAGRLESHTTRLRLIDEAERLFTAHGYSATSLDAIVAAADVTKGALYHHFSGKQALFEEVFAQVEGEAAVRVWAALATETEPWRTAQAGIRAFLAEARTERYQRVVIQDGPVVLGHARYREREERSTFATTLAILRAVIEAGRWPIEEEMVQTFGRIFHGALTASAESVSTAVDQQAAVERVQAAITIILRGLESRAAERRADPESV